MVRLASISNGLSLVRRLATKLDRPVAVLQDIQGPKLRVGEFVGGQLMLRAGQRVVLTTRKVSGSGGTTPTPIRWLPQQVKPGEAILTRKDKADLAFGQRIGVDFLALSFASSADDVERARPYVARLKTPPQAVANLKDSQLGVGLVVAYTESGYTARLISEFRPKVPILALTPNPDVVRRIALYWGVQGLLVQRIHATDAILAQVRRLCRERRICSVGTPVVIVADLPLNVPGNTNLMSIHPA